MALSYSQFYYGSSSGTLATFNAIRERTLGVPQSDIQDVIVNFDDRHIYYCSSGNGIFRSDLNLENISGLVNQSGCVAIDIDFSGGFIYALNQIEGSITRYNISGFNPSGIVSSGIINGTDLELDLINNDLYWCERGSGVGSGLIRKLSSLIGGPFTQGFSAGFDGSIQIVTSGLSGPAGLALDTEENLIYFSDDVDSQIKQIPLSGGAASGLVSGSLISSPQKLQLDISRPFGLKSFESKILFWADKDLNFINAKSLTTSTSGSLAGSGIVVSGASPIGFDFTRRIPKIRPGWHNTCFTSRRRLIIDDANGGILNDIPIELNTNIPPLKFGIDRDPILQSFKSEEFGGKVASNSGLDILLASDDGLTQIPHEIEKYDPETGDLLIWALAPEVFDLQTTTLYMYYGDQDPFTDNQNANGIWDLSHEAVWHLSELPVGDTGEIKDSTSNAHNGTASGSPTRVSGIHAFGMEFGVGDAINIDDTFDPPQSGTLLLRFFTSGQVSGAIFGIGDGFELEILPSSTGPHPSGMTVQSRIFATGTDVLKYTNTFGGVPPILPDAWHEIGITWDFNTGETRIIINGDLRPEHNNSSNQADDDPGTGKLSIGKSTEGVKPTTRFILDEVRIANRPFSPSEVRTAFRVNVSDFADEEFEGQIYFERNEQVLLGDNLRFDPPTNTIPFWLNTPDLKNIPPFAVVEIAIINSDDTAALRGGVGYRDPAIKFLPGLLSRGAPGGFPGNNRLIDIHDADLAEIGSGINVYTVHVSVNEDGAIDGWGEQPIPFEPSLTINVIGYWTSGVFETIEWGGGSFPSASGQWVSFDTNLTLDPLTINNDVVEIITVQPLQFDPVIVGVRASGSFLERKFNLHEAPDGVDNLTLFSQAKSGIIEVFAEHSGVNFIVNGWWSIPPDVYTEKHEKIGNPSGTDVWSTHELADFLPKNNNTVIEVVLSNQESDTVNAFGIREIGSDIERLFELHETHDSEDGPSTQDVIRLHTNVIAKSGCGKETSVPAIELYHTNPSDILNESGFIMVGVWGQGFLSQTADIFTLNIVGHLPINSGIDLHITGIEEEFPYIEKFDTWFATSPGVWQQKDLTPFGVPSGAVVEILITNIDESLEREGGVRAIGSILERRFDIHEAEGGGEEGLCMHVQADGSGFIEHYAEDTADIKFTILGCWSGDVEYIERNDHFDASSFDDWVTLDVSASGANLSLLSVVEVIALQNHGSIEQSGGVRTQGSIIERKFKLHKAEGGGLDFATFTTNAITGIVEVFSSDPLMSFQLVGYWAKPPGSYNELFLDIGDAPEEGGADPIIFGSVDLRGPPFSVPPFSTIDLTLVNENPSVPLRMGTRQQLSSFNRVIDLHKAERFGVPPTAQDVVRMQVAGRQLSIIEIGNEEFDDTNFKIIGYWGELGSIPIDDSITLFIQAPEALSSGIDLFLEAPAIPGPPIYVEKFDTIISTVAGSWEVQDLSSFNIPFSGVLDIAILNTAANPELEGGVRAFGSTLERKIDLHEAEGGGTETTVFHVQVGPDNKIETFAESTTNIEFRILGVWSGSVHYIERFDFFQPSSGNGWAETDISASGADLGADKIAEIVGLNTNTTDELAVGVRSQGSTINRRFDIHKAESDGSVPATFLVNTASGTVELFAENLTDISFRLVGYWEIPPQSYTERFELLTKPGSTFTWEEIDLASSNITDNAVVDVQMINRSNPFEFEMGARPKGSTLARVIDIHKAEKNPSSEFAETAVRFQTNTTPGSTLIEFNVERPDLDNEIMLLGFWAQEPVNNNIDLFTQGHIGISSGIDLFLQNNLVTSGIDLFLENKVRSDQIDLFTQGHETTTSGIDLIIPGHEVNQSGIDLITIGHDTISDQIDLFILPNETISGQIDLIIIGHTDASGSIDLFIAGPIPIESGIDLFLSNTFVNNTIDLSLVGHEICRTDDATFDFGFNEAFETTDCGIPLTLFIKGIDTASGSITLFMGVAMPASGAIDLFIQAPESTSSGIDLFIPSKDIIDDNIDLVILGKETIQDDIDLVIPNVIDEISGSIDLVVVGHELIPDDIALFIEGVGTTSGDITLFISGPQSINDDITLFLGAQPVASGTIDLFIKNAFAANTTTLFVEGFLQRQRACGIFFGDATGDNITKIDLIGGISIEEQVFPASDPAGFDTDNVSGLLYWFDLSNFISRGLRRTGFSIPSGETSTTRTDIENLSTSSSKVDRVSDIAIDINNGKIYWSDTDDDVIRKANINIPDGEDASNRTDIEDILLVTNPISLVLDKVNDKIYWCSTLTDDIRRANLDGSNEEVIISSGDVGLQFFAPDRLDINTRLGKIYWYTNTDSLIQRANLDGSDIETIVEFNDPIRDVEAIVTDDVNIYFSDNSLNSIFKKSLDGKGPSILITDNVPNPGINALALQLCPYESETITLHISGPTAIEDDITIFLAANTILNVMTLFTVASGSTQTWDLFLKAAPEPEFFAADNLNLILRGSASGESFFFTSEDINLFLQAPPEPVIEEFGLNTIDAELFLKGPFESDDNNNWQLFLKADSSTDASVTMQIQGHASGSAPAGALNCNDITLFMSNIADNPNEIGFTPINEQWILFLKVRLGFSEEMTLSISGFIPTIGSDTPVDLFIRGFDVNTQDISLHIFGVSGILSNNIDLSIPNVIDDDDDNIELYIHGF